MDDCKAGAVWELVASGGDDDVPEADVVMRVAAA